MAEEDQGLASGLLGTSQEIGTAVGLALLASLATVTARASDLSSVAETLTAGYRAGFLGAAALMGLALLAATRVPSAAGQDSEGEASSGLTTAGDAAPRLGSD